MSDITAKAEKDWHRIIFISEVELNASAVTKR